MASGSLPRWTGKGEVSPDWRATVADRARRTGQLVSRRQALASAGGAAMVGAAFGSAPGAAAAKARGPVRWVTARLGETATRLVGVIDQKANSFVAYGFYTLIAGLGQAELFSAQTDPVSESQAFYTFHGTASLVQRTVVGDVFTLAVAGSLASLLSALPGVQLRQSELICVGSQNRHQQVRPPGRTHPAVARPAGLATLEGQVTQVGARPFRVGGRTRPVRARRPQDAADRERTGSGSEPYAARRAAVARGHPGRSRLAEPPVGRPR